MALDIENQIKEIHAVLDEFRHKLKISDHFFATSIVPKPKMLEEEFCLINRLIRYEKPALIFTANEIECNSKPAYHNNKKNSLSLLKYINIPLLIVTFVFTAIIFYRYYHNYHKFSIYTLIGFWIVILFTIFLIIVKILNVISEVKNKHCVYLVRQAIELKEKNTSEEELQQIFGSAKDLMTEVRAQKIKGEKLISLLEKAVRQKEINKESATIIQPLPTKSTTWRRNRKVFNLS